MQRSLIVIMIVCLLVVVFALQNMALIHLKVWFWSVDMHTGLVLIITFAVGTLLGIVSSVPLAVKRKKQIRELRELAENHSGVQDPESPGEGYPLGEGGSIGKERYGHFDKGRKE